MNIYLSTEDDFAHNGLGFLTDILKASITNNLNGDYSLYFEYKINGHLNEYIKNENIVKCKVSDGSKQLFVIKNVVKTFDLIQVSCKHIFYTLLDNFIEDTAPKNLSCQSFLNWIFSKTNFSTKFKLFSDITTTKSARYVRKNPVEVILGEESNSVVNLFGGELKRDNFNIYVNKNVGNDNGVKLIVGKNITGVNITIDTNNVYTRIMPQGFDGLFLPEKYVDSPLINNYINPKICKVEFSDIKYDPEDESAYQNVNEAYEALRILTKELFDNGIDKPKINVKIDWIELSKTNEYKNYSNLEKILLGDIITVDLLGLTYKTKVIKTVYNFLLDRIDSFEIGTLKANIGTSTNSIQKQIEKINPTSILESARNNATQMLTKAMGGYVYKTQNELFIMDTNNPQTATKIWRWNLNGLGYSNNGIDGPYEIAMTSDGQIIADFITTGKLNTNVIEGYDQIVIDVAEQNKKTTQLALSLEEIKGEISDIADVTITVEGNSSIIAKNINESEPISIKIHPTSNENYSFLYPGEDLYPGENTFTKSRTLLFENTNGYSISYEIPNDLLYLDENTYDEFVLDYENRKCYIIHKVGINENNENYKLTTETTEYFDYPTIALEEGDYTISTPSSENTYIYARLMTKSLYTSQFATQIEMNAKIEAKANEINLEVDQKVDNKDYTNAKITAIINDGTSAVKIKADRIDLTGYLTIASANSTYASKSGLSGGTTTINGGCITTGTIDASKVIVKNLNADNITSGTIDASKITVKNISANNIISGTIDASKVTVKNLNADNITSGTLTADKISGGTISASAINLGNGVCKITTSGQLTCSNIKATGGTIAGLTINEEAIFNGKGIGTAGSCGMSYNIDGWAFWAGNGAYRVTHEGKVICSNIEVSGGSINIQRGNYYFNMGLATSNPSCSGLNVGYYGIKANSNITATGFAITDSDTGKSYSIGIRDYNGHVHYLTFTGGILTAWEYV